jgi:hypothetical protein
VQVSRITGNQGAGDQQAYKSGLFMQNKPNFHKAKMKAKPTKTKDYEKRWALRVEQKQSQTKPIASSVNT